MNLLRRVGFFLAVLLLCACSNSGEAFHGEWTQHSGQRTGSTLTFNPDGTGFLRIRGGVGYEIESWNVATDQHLEMRIEGQDVLSRYALNDGSLVISRSDKFQEMNGTYSKRG